MPIESLALRASCQSPAPIAPQVAQARVALQNLLYFAPTKSDVKSCQGPLSLLAAAAGAAIFFLVCT